MKLHSMVDTITNRSTEIYTWVLEDAHNKFYNIVKKILLTLGIDKDPQDIFTVEYRVDKRWKEDMHSILLASISERTIPKEQLSEFIEEEIPAYLDSGGYKSSFNITKALSMDYNYPRGLEFVVRNKITGEVILDSINDFIFTDSKVCARVD